MPIYEYRCSDCGQTFEALQKFSAEPFQICSETAKVECPKDGQGKVERLMSSPAFHFTGTGFYITDYAKSGAKGEGESKGESKGEGKTESKSEGKTDTKSENKSESKPESGVESKAVSKPETKSEPKPAAKPSDSGSSTKKD